MSEKLISFGVTTDEFNEIQDMAKEKNMSVSMYCKSRIFPESEFEKHYNYLLEKIKNYPKNIIFSIRDVFGKDWDNIPTGVKLAIGRQFYSQVNSKIINNINEEGYGAARTMRYSKKN